MSPNQKVIDQTNLLEGMAYNLDCLSVDAQQLGLVDSAAVFKDQADKMSLLAENLWATRPTAPMAFQDISFIEDDDTNVVPFRRTYP